MDTIEHAFPKSIYHQQAGCGITSTSHASLGCLGYDDDNILVELTLICYIPNEDLYQNYIHESRIPSIWLLPLQT